MPNAGVGRSLCEGKITNKKPTLLLDVKTLLHAVPRGLQTKIWSLKTGGLLIEGHLNFNIRMWEMKLWSLNRGGLLIKVDARAGLTVLPFPGGVSCRGL